MRIANEIKLRFQHQSFITGKNIRDTKRSNKINSLNETIFFLKLLKQYFETWL